MPRTSTPKPTEGQPEETASVQDYLAAIYDLAGSGKPVIGARVAKHMSISAPAVTEAVHRMARGGYVKIGAGKSLTLTPKGREIAEVMARRHRLLERWLTDTLGLNWTDAHEEAHRWARALPRVEGLSELLECQHVSHGNPSWACRRRRGYDRFRSPTRARVRPWSSSALPKKRRRTRSSSSTSGGTTSAPAAASRSSKSRPGRARSPRPATVKRSRSGSRPPPRSGCTPRIRPSSLQLFLGGSRSGPGVGDHLGDAVAVFAWRRDGEELLPRLDGAGGVLLRFVEDLTAIEQGGGIVRVKSEGLLEGLERAVGVAADRAMRPLVMS